MRCWEREHVGDWHPDDPKEKPCSEGCGLTSPVWVWWCCADGGSQVFGLDASIMLWDITSKNMFVGFRIWEVRLEHSVHYSADTDLSQTDKRWIMGWQFAWLSKRTENAEEGSRDSFCSSGNLTPSVINDNAHHLYPGQGSTKEYPVNIFLLWDLFQLYTKQI